MWKAIHDSAPDASGHSREAEGQSRGFTHETRHAAPTPAPTPHRGNCAETLRTGCHAVEMWSEWRCGTNPTFWRFDTTCKVSPRGRFQKASAHGARLLTTDACLSVCTSTT